MDLISQEGISILTWQGDITFQNVDAFRERINELMAQETVCMILNMEQVLYVNSAALGILADAVVKGRRNGKELVIAGIQPIVHEIFSIVKFEKFVKLYMSMDDALQYGRQMQSVK